MSTAGMKALRTVAVTKKHEVAAAKPDIRRRTTGAMLKKTAPVSRAESPGSVRAKVFQNGRSQAVRLPKQFRFDGKEVQVSRQGTGVLLTPIETRTTQQYWDDYFKALEPYKDLPFPDCEDEGVTEPEDIFAEGWV